MQLTMNAIVIALVFTALNLSLGSLGSEVSTVINGSQLRCAYFRQQGEVEYKVHLPDDDVVDERELEEHGTLDVAHNVRQCYSNACYSLWQVDYSVNSTGVNVFVGQGCWETSLKDECRRNNCAADKPPPKALNTTKFCCCTGDLCNTNVTDMYVPSVEEHSNHVPADATYQSRSSSPLEYQHVLMICIGFLLLCVILFIGLAVFRLWQHKAEYHKPDHQVHLMENGAGPQESFSVDHLKLDSIVGQGRYGSVWRGNVRNQEVAVKIFPSHYRNYFLNERDIYTLAFMESPALLSYFGYDERPGPEGSSEYLLVLSYAPNGCLQDYLRNNSIDCATFCKMSLTIAKGLAHLHTDVKKGDKSKPCVTHRDLNTRNILVKSDLSCCLCDLGFAMKISGSKYYSNGEEQHAETKSINDVGTLRYMAPEVLEGAVNLRDCETSLKQIDVYALGLVLWELSSRCSDFYQGGIQQTPAYALPFQLEVGHHPSFEQMQVLVSRHKARPLFSEAWKDWTAIKLLRETIEDCWDQDAEARLTALCVEERLQELPSLWDRKRATLYVSGVSPTVNSTQSPAVGIRTTVNNTEHGRLIESEDTAGSLNKDMQESTVSEGTVETMLTMTPSEPNPEPPYKISNHTIGVSYRPLSTALQQPYQGRNPCMERNLMTEEHDTGGTCNLIDRSFKHAASHTQSHFNAMPPDSQNDYLALQNNTTRLAMPIPFVQNVYETNNYAPKQPNIAAKARSRWSWGNGLKKLFEKRGGFFGRGENCPEGEDEAKSNLLVRSPVEETKPPLIVDTQVCLPTKGKGVVTSIMEEGIKDKSVRPSTLPLKPVEVSTRLEDQFTSNSTCRLLKDINSRVKTPGDVPLAVRRARGKRTAARFSLYDDRMMTANNGYAESLSDMTFSCSVPSDIDIAYVVCNGDKTEAIHLAGEKDSSSF